MGFGFDFGFGMFGIMFMLMFGIFLVTIVRGVGQWNKNNHSLRLTVLATVVSKRANVLLLYKRYIACSICNRYCSAQNEPRKYECNLDCIPHLAEQKRIVAKLEEILPLCEWLK